MSTGAGTSGAAAAAAAIAQATKASGVIVRVEPRDFLSILEQEEGPLVVHATGGFFNTNYQYLTSYKGLAFFTKSQAPINLPRGTELVQAKKIWIPSSVQLIRCGILPLTVRGDVSADVLFAVPRRNVIENSAISILSIILNIFRSVLIFSR